MNELMQIAQSSAPQLLMAGILWAAFGMKKDIEAISKSIVSLNEKVSILIAEKTAIEDKVENQQKQIEKLNDMVQDLRKRG